MLRSSASERDLPETWKTGGGHAPSRCCGRSAAARAGPFKIGCLSAGQGGYQFRRAVHFFFGVVVVRGEPDQWMRVAVLGVQWAVPGHGGGHVDSGTAQGPGRLLGSYPVDLGGDDGAAEQAEVVDGDAAQSGQLAAEPGAQRGGALPDRHQAQVKGLPDGGTQAQDVDVAVLPGGKSLRAGRPGEAVLAVPG